MATKTPSSPGSGGVTIPIRKVVINDPSEMPLDFGTTPGGTMFSTTPGGTRIVYDRKFLLEMKNSPLSKTPPRNLPHIPGVTPRPSPKEKESASKCISPPPPSSTSSGFDKHDFSDEQFSMEIESK